METVKKTAEYEIIKKRSGRYGVRDARRKWITGDDKVKILLAEKLIKAPPPKEKPPEPAAEKPAAKAAPAKAKAEAREEPAKEEAPPEAPADEEVSE